MEDKEKQAALAETKDENLVEIYEKVEEFMKFLDTQIDAYEEKES